MKNAGRNSRVLPALPILTIALGVLLLVYMIVVEDEPGAIPLGLIVFGVAWLVTTRVREKRRRI